MKNIITQAFVVCALAAINSSSISAKESQPTTLAKLEKSTLAIAHPCRQATVGMTVGNSQGTGVIVSAEGLVLTAFHCVDYVGREFEVILSDGTRAKAIAIYGDANADIALATILDKAPEGGWPHRPLKMDGDLKEGDWCVAFGNSAGIQSNRPAPMRIGRVIGTHKWHGKPQLITDNTLVSGDSGGPLFDLKGQLVGINSNVGNLSALANHHALVSKIIQLWGDTLRGDKPLPDVASLRKLAKQQTDKTKTQPKTTAEKGLSPAQRKHTTKVLKKQFGDDFPQEVIDIILKASYHDPKKQEVNIQITPAVIKQIQQAGYDPIKIGLITKAQAKDLGIKPNQKPAPKKKNQQKTKQQLALEKTLRNQFKGHKISDEAMEILVSITKKDPITGQIKLALTNKVIMQLKNAGLDLKDIQNQALNKQLSKALQGPYNNKLSKEALGILLSASTFNQKTKSLKINLSPAQFKKLEALGVDLSVLGLTNKPDSRYLKMADAYGDSSGIITQSFPKMDDVIRVFSAGQYILIATPVTTGGYLMTKSSALPDDQKIQVEIKGEKLAAKIISRDKESDLALLKVELKGDSRLKLPKWSSDKLHLGQLLVSPTTEKPMLGIIGNLPRIIPTNLIGAGNGNKAILGVKSLSDKSANAKKGITVEEADQRFPAGKGGIRKGDIITHWNSKPVINIEQLTKKVGQHAPGDQVELTVLRNGKKMKFTVTLGEASNSELFAQNSTSSIAQKISAQCGTLSKRRIDFPESITHDTLLWASDCGGPLYNRKGEVIGINIARYDRTACYALTRKSVKAAFKRLLPAK